MLLKLRSTLELLILCPGILSRISPRVINTDLQYAIGLRRVRDAVREEQHYVTACTMLHELHEHSHLRSADLSTAGLQALRKMQEYYRKLDEAHHQCVPDEISECSGLNTQDSILHEIREHHGTGR